MAKTASLSSSCLIENIEQNEAGVDFVLTANDEKIEVSIPRKRVPSWGESAEVRAGVPYWRFFAERTEGLGFSGSDPVVRIDWTVNENNLASEQFNLQVLTGGAVRTVSCGTIMPQ